MNVLRVRNDVGGPFVAVVPFVDRASLVDLVDTNEKSRGFDVPGSYAGLARDRDFAADRWIPSTEGPRRAELLGCECGEGGCWPLVARIGTTGILVVRDRFEQTHRPARL